MTGDRALDFVLPGSWAFIPLENPAATDTAIARLVTRSFGRRDEDARLRAELRSRFTASAHQARTAGASQLHLCLELVPGVPLPASLTVYWPRITLRHTRETDPAVALRTVLGSPTTGESDDELPGSPSGPAVRRSRLITPDREDADAGPESQAGLTTLEVDYWLATRTGRVLLLSFACGMPLLREQLTGLFDLIVQTVTWRDDPVGDAS
ncbi:hypothetical protein BH09ACT6_BH09ACT6_03850 [soil metagenome]